MKFLSYVISNKRRFRRLRKNGENGFGAKILSIDYKFMF